MTKVIAHYFALRSESVPISNSIIGIEDSVGPSVAALADGQGGSFDLR
jgi:hypothetical protein